MQEEALLSESSGEEDTRNSATGGERAEVAQRSPNEVANSRNSRMESQTSSRSQHTSSRKKKRGDRKESGAKKAAFFWGQKGSSFYYENVRK